MALPVPDDTFAEILRRLTPKTLAVARCVCKPWRELVDGRELLLRLLLPRSVDGVLINYVNHRRPHLLSRPRSSSFSSSSLPASCVGRIVDGNLTAVPAGDRAWWTVMDHCDGLILCDVYWGSRLFVCNTATRRWATLPSPRPEPEPGAYAGKYLAFDPAVSPHYEVLLIPALPEKSLPSPTDHVDVDDDDDDEAYLLMEWPPSPYKVDVFSSATGRWVEREFVREEGEAVMTVKDMKSWEYAFARPRQGYSVFWQGALYVHSGGHFITRFSTSSDKYQVIKTPIIIPNNKFEKTYLGKSKMGVSFGFIDDYQLSVWILKESAGQIEWVLNYQHDLWVAANQIDSIVFHGHKINGPWRVLEETIPKYIIIENKSYKDPEWDSDNDDFLDTEVDDEEHDFAHFRILGFHPYKEVIFLEETFRTFAYHLNSSKIQYLATHALKIATESTERVYMSRSCTLPA